MNDWRLRGQERYLKGAVLKWAAYKPLHEGWDHDHCEFCNRKFMDREEELREGYVTLDGRHWVCKGCAEDFRIQFEWSITS
jgi:hypothetical protein